MVDGRPFMARILLVDDDDAARYATARLLATAGYDVVEAHDYHDALAILEDGTSLDLLVLDIVLPEVHGFALARMARMKHHGLRCIHITGFDVPTSEALGPVLRKPLDHDLLLAEVERELALA